MIAITPYEVTPALAALFDLTQPTMPRAFNVLKGIVRGQTVVDDLAHPTWAVVQDATFGTLYCGGQLNAPTLAAIVEYFRQFSDVGIGCWPESDVNSMLPPNPDYDGRTLYFTHRSPHIALALLMHQLPPEYVLLPRNTQNVTQSFDYDMTLAAFGTVERILQLTLGVMVMRDGIVCCEAATGAATHGRIEVGVTTAEAYRQHGLATCACAALIALCEEQGYATWWDCAKQNVPSARLARKLGYQNEREYRYVWWTRHEVSAGR